MSAMPSDPSSAEWQCPPNPPILDDFPQSEIELPGASANDMSSDLDAMVNQKTRQSGFEYQLGEEDLRLIESDRKTVRIRGKPRALQLRFKFLELAI